MDVNQNMLMELAKQLGLEENSQSAVKEAAGVSAEYRDKSEEDILDEIIKLKHTIKSNPAQFKKQLAAIKSLRGMMNKEQQERLDRVIDMLERD